MKTKPTVVPRETHPSTNGRSADDSGAVRVVAVVFERASAVAIAIGRLADGSQPFRHEQARRFAAAEVSALRGVLKDAAVDVVIRVAPTGQTLARVTALPESATDHAALADALALVAESELPAHLPWYRRTGGLVRTTGNDGRTAAPWAILLGWHKPAQPAPDQLAATLEGFRQIWTTEIVALARLLRGASVAESDDPDNAAWIASPDRSAGTISVAACRGDKLGVRVLRAPAADSARWSQIVAAAVADTVAALAAPVKPVSSPPFGIDAERTLLASPSLAPVVAGGRHDAEWLDQFAIPSAILETFADPDPAVRLLFNLHWAEPRRRLGIVRGLANWLSVPARAAAAVAACVAILLLVPMGIAYARHSTLQKHVATVAGLDERLAGAEKDVAFYALLREKRWPMTKLLSDIATSTPQGITLDLLEVAQGESISLHGVAESYELVTTFRENLAKTRVFDNIAAPNTTSADEGVQFKIEARVSPTGAVYRDKPIDDFAANPLGRRIHGDSWTLPSSDSSAESGTNSTRRKRDSAASTTATGLATSSGSAGTGPAAAVMPPLSDDDIAKLDRTAAMLEWTKRQAASTRATDPEVKQRLLDESVKARKRFNELKGDK